MPGWASAPGHHRTVVRMSARRGCQLKVQPRGTCFQMYVIVAGAQLVGHVQSCKADLPNTVFPSKAGRKRDVTGGPVVKKSKLPMQGA